MVAKTHHNTCPRGERCACYITGYTDAEHNHGLSLDSLESKPPDPLTEIAEKAAKQLRHLDYGDRTEANTAIITRAIQEATVTIRCQIVKQETLIREAN